MVIFMNDQEPASLEQVQAFPEVAEPVVFALQSKEACYAWFERTLFCFHRSVKLPSVRRQCGDEQPTEL